MWGPQWSAMYGVYGPHEPEELLPAREPARHAAGPSCYPAWIRAFRAGELSTGAELAVHRPDGSFGWMPYGI